MNKKVPIMVIILIVVVILLLVILYPEAIASMISIASRPSPMGSSTIGGGGLL